MHLIIDLKVRDGIMKKVSGLLVLQLLLAGALAGARPALAADGFSREKRLEHLKVLAETIGPRPLGTPQEKAALTYFAEKLAEFGCRVEWQPVTGGKSMIGAAGLNTASFNVIGWLPGSRTMRPWSLSPSAARSPASSARKPSSNNIRSRTSP